MGKEIGMCFSWYIEWFGVDVGCDWINEGSLVWVKLEIKMITYILKLEYQSLTIHIYRQ